MNLKWEYQLMRDMLERANLCLSIPTDNMQKIGMMLRQAASVITHWDRKIANMEIALTKISNGEFSQSGSAQDRMDAVRAIAWEALATTEDSSVDRTIF